MMVLNEGGFFGFTEGVNEGALRMAGRELFQGAAWAVKSSPWYQAQQLH